MNLTDRRLSGESAQSSRSTKKSVYLMVMSRSYHAVLFVRSSSLTMIWYLGEHHGTLTPFAKAMCAVRNGLQHLFWNSICRGWEMENSLVCTV
jgi:hypothetical protein